VSSEALYSRVDHVARSAIDYPGGKAAPGPEWGTERSLQPRDLPVGALHDQAEVDRLTADAARPVRCGRLKNTFGVS
jgi:hypothetical protein